MQKIKKLFILLTALTALLMMPAAALAAVIPGEQQAIPSANPQSQPSSTQTIKSDTLGNDCPKFANKTGICSDNPIIRNLNTVVNVLSGLVGVVVVGTIILGGIQYAMAGDKAEAVSAAKQRIINGLIALLAFLFIFAFLQWLIPGGVFK